MRHRPPKLPRLTPATRNKPHSTHKLTLRGVHAFCGALPQVFCKNHGYTGQIRCLCGTMARQQEKSSWGSSRRCCRAQQVNIMTACGLACFHLRDSCVLVRVSCARAHGVDLKKSPGSWTYNARRCRVLFWHWITVNKQEADSNGMEFCVFSQQRSAGRGPGDGCVFGVHGKRLHDPQMYKGTMCKIAGTFGIFQAAMPMTAGCACIPSWSCLRPLRT